MMMMGDSVNDWSKIEKNCHLEKQIVSQNDLDIRSLADLNHEE